MDNASRRVWILMLPISAAGCAAAFWMGGWRAGAGFAGGAALSAINFRWLKRTVDLIGANERPRRASGGVLALRYILVGAIAYGIVNYFELSILAVLAGLLAAVAAVILEILYELIFSKTDGT